MKEIGKKGLQKWFGGALFAIVFSSFWLSAAELQPIKLNPPDLKRGLPFMQALSVKASVREFSE